MYRTTCNIYRTTCIALVALKLVEMVVLRSDDSIRPTIMCHTPECVACILRPHNEPNNAIRYSLDFYSTSKTIKRLFVYLKR